MAAVNLRLSPVAVEDGVWRRRFLQAILNPVKLSLL